ncbi:hypothetical protein B9Z55_029074 [Caenorhabditis nigoni]|uniref:Uncharacterized protein n=1 Tax=Caenorhabditis nigoni TaxID=1611254 RepID=A0A2G5S974_9PELO|nr:hypothetical protein B9Z55_029074 [Caenorhabditis nigoni]
MKRPDRLASYEENSKRLIGMEQLEGRDVTGRRYRKEGLKLKLGRQMMKPVWRLITIERKEEEVSVFTRRWVD